MNNRKIDGGLFCIGRRRKGEKWGEKGGKRSLTVVENFTADS